MKMIILIILMMFISTPAFADELQEGKRYTFYGKVEFDKDNTKSYVVDDTRNNVQGVFNEIDLNNGTFEFRKCLGGGQYKGDIEITAIVQFKFQDDKRGVTNGAGLKIDKSSVCKRR